MEAFYGVLHAMVRVIFYGLCNSHSLALHPPDIPQESCVGAEDWGLIGVQTKSSSAAAAVV